MLVRQLPAIGRIALGTVIVAAITAGAQIDKIRSTVRAQDLIAFCGTSNIKIVFRLNGVGLCAADFSAMNGTNANIYSISGTLDGRFPVISPDGAWIAYSTGASDEYSADPAAVWLAQLAASPTPVKVAEPGYVPRFAYAATAPTLVYSTCAKHPGNCYAWRGCGRVIKAAYSGTSWSYDTIHRTGSYLAGLSYDERYLAHAEQRLYSFLLDLRGAADQPAVLHMIAASPPQVCNASVSSSKIYTNVLMYLDFGYTAGLPSLGKWGFHDRIFVTRNDGAILRYFDVPAEVPVVPSAAITGIGEIGGTQWAYPEWSNHPYYAVTSLQVSRKFLVDGSWTKVAYNKSEAVYLVNLKDSTYLRILESADTSGQSRVDIFNPYAFIQRDASLAEQPGWLEPAVYTPSAPAAPDTACSTVPPDTTDPHPSKRKSGCGSGIGLSLVPLIGIRVARSRKGRMK